MDRGVNLGKISLSIAFILSVFVTVLNFSGNSYINGTIMAVVSLLTLIELIRQLKNKNSSLTKG